MYQGFNPRTPGGVRPSPFLWFHPQSCFNPRTPGGVRHRGVENPFGHIWFQSTHPGWGATIRRRVIRIRIHVSIHAPRVGCDALSPTTTWVLTVSIHAPRVGCDDEDANAYWIVRVSIHAPRVGCDNALMTMRVSECVSIHAPRVGCDWRFERLLAKR